MIRFAMSFLRTLVVTIAAAAAQSDLSLVGSCATRHVDVEVDDLLPALMLLQTTANVEIFLESNDDATKHSATSPPQADKVLADADPLASIRAVTSNNEAPSQSGFNVDNALLFSRSVGQLAPEALHSSLQEENLADRGELTVSENFTFSADSFAQGYGDIDSPERMKSRGDVYLALTELLDNFWSHGVRAFPVFGLLLGIARSGGFIPFDRDNDLAILDVDKPKYDQIKGWYRNVGGFPLADVQVWTTDASQTMVQTEASTALPVHPSLTLPLEDLTNFVNISFYCRTIRVPRGYEKYLALSYGADWNATQINKCNNPEGDLFRTDPAKCTWTCYEGAMEFPYKSTPSRGEIDIDCRSASRVVSALRTH